MLHTKVGLLTVSAVAALALAACGSGSSGGSNASGGSSSSAAGGGASSASGGGASSASSQAYKIGLLLPETAVARYETKDKPYFKAKLEELCASCELLYANANGDAAAQQTEAQSMLTQGAKVLVVDPLDGVAAASIVAAAKAKGVPVVAYDRLIKSPDLSFVISNDYKKVGELQGQALVDRLKAGGLTSGGIVMMNGATTDNNAGNIKKGALSKITGSGFDILASTDTWDPATAQTWAAGQITKFGSKIVGVYSANDGNAGGAIAAFKAAGVKKVPPMTGLDASVAGLQAILAGDQFMTTYNAFKSEAESAAVAALDLAQGKTPQSSAKVENIPAVLNPPTAVTLETIKSTVIADGFYKASELCTADYAAACTKAGIQ